MIKARNLERAQVVTANRLRDGAVVFLAGDGSWSIHVDDAAVARDQEEEARLLGVGAADTTACVVIAPYLIEVEIEGEQVTPMGPRERIRAFGPTVAVPTTPRAAQS